MFKRIFFILFLISSANVIAGTCYEIASEKYNVSAELLRAIAIQESGERINVVNINKNGTRDIGWMQINSAWLPLLAKHGIYERDLYDSCVNILVGAWILSNNFSKLGYNVQGLGAYNATSFAKREKYAKQVLSRLAKINNEQP